MSEYRWNLSEYAVGYDTAADVIHPHYLEIQDAILAGLPFPADAEILLVDLGGGSGRLAARFLDRWPRAQAIVVDQSDPFLALAERRLAAFGGRGTCVLARLQDDWRSKLPQPAGAIVSMSAIHHLEPAEKRAVYQEAFEALAPGGIFLNGDEVRPERDYRREVEAWAEHMRRHMASGSIGEAFHPALDKSPWVVCAFHHPIFSTGKDRDNPTIRNAWKPVFDQYRVDLVLQGHDHTYGRTGLQTPPATVGNVPTGVNKVDPETGTVYVVSVSGPKMYNLQPHPFMKRTAEDTQLYQIIHLDGDQLQYEARTATGEVYDSFVLEKEPGKPNKLTERSPQVAERRRVPQPENKASTEQPSAALRSPAARTTPDTPAAVEPTTAP